MPRGDGTGPPGGPGPGRGLGGGDRGRMGGSGVGTSGDRVCPQCGKTVPHQRGRPCPCVKCPDCDSPMTRQRAPTIDDDGRRNTISRADGTGPPGGAGLRNGRGRMGGSGMDTSRNCVCRRCGRTMPYHKGIPCTSVACPNCDLLMTRQRKYVTRNQ